MKSMNKYTSSQVIAPDLPLDLAKRSLPYGIEAKRYAHVFVAEFRGQLCPVL